MEIDWGLVKKQTLWSYDDLVKKLLEVLAFDFVKKTSNHTMAEARDFAAKVQMGYLQGRSEGVFIQEILEHFSRLDDLGIENYLDLVQRVEDKGNCEDFLLQTGFSFEALIETLNYLFRWVLPFKIPLRELFDLENEEQRRAFEIFKIKKIGSNLELLERGRMRSGRKLLSVETGLQEVEIEDLVHKADISRLAYVRGKTVRHLCGGGYDTLAKIAQANLNDMEIAMERYYQTLGKSLADFQAVIPLQWMIGGAQILPVVVE